MTDRLKNTLLYVNTSFDVVAVQSGP